MGVLNCLLFGICLVMPFISCFEAVPCSSIVVKEQEGLLSYLARITFTVPVSTTEEGWSAILKFDNGFTGVGVWDLFVQNFGSEKYCRFLSRDDKGNHELVAGQTFSFRFRVNYGRNVPVPHASSFSFMGIPVCG